AAGLLALGVYGRGSPSFLLCRLAFDYYLARDTPEIEAQVRTGLSNVYYFTSYYLNGMLSAAEGTGSERLLRRVMRNLDAMIAAAEPFEDGGRPCRGWKPFYVTADSSVARPSLHFTFQAAVPVGRAAAVIMSRPRWRAKYGADARRYAAFADELVIQYWYRARMRERIAWIDPDHFPLWNDNASNLALVAVFLYQATGDPVCKDIGLRVGRAFQAKLAPAGNGWIWEDHTIPVGSDTDNTPGSVGNQEGVPDVSHANREAFLMLALHETGLMFGRADLERMAATFTDFVWNRSEDFPGFANYINGSDKPYRVYKEPGLNGSVYHGWVLMGGYSSRAQRVVLRTIAALARGRRNPSLERNATSYGGKVGLCGHALRNFHRLRLARAKDARRE
ncbi:MAG: hypothetical protein PHF00_08450, partial [Elusimicrobia bacterium]|nr:hypothetical protein [Elusimicrobiota bacterium]